MKFIMYADPGHAWLKVPRAWLQFLEIEEEITPYSYQRGIWVYLEEDCDYSTFIGAWKKRFVHPLEIVEKHTNRRSKIRSYEYYAPTQRQQPQDA